MSTPTEIAPTPRRAWLIWSVGAGVYVLAVFHRSALGVAGPMAAERLDISAGQLSTFVMLQLAMYAAMQVPTGLLVDRFGPRRMLLAATLTMGTAEVLFAFVTSYPFALLARGLLGMGDAMTYISVLRLAAGWFPARRYPIITSYTGLLGTFGNLIATIPLTGLLHQFGWTPTFLTAGAVSLAYALVLVRKATVAPFREVGAAGAPVAGTRVLTEVTAAWSMPGGRLGFWVHFTTMSGSVVFSVLWGFPYLTQVTGLSIGTASSWLLGMVVIGLVANLVVGRTLARRPDIRTHIAVFVSLGCLTGWIVLVAWPGGRPPTPVVAAVVAVLAVGGPASAVAFQLARDYNPRHRISTATGLVNIGGFCAAVIGTFAVGFILDLVDGDTDVHSAEGFRWAFAALALLTAFGLWRLLTWWLRTRAVVLLAEARGEDVPVRVQRHRFELVDDAILAQEALKAEQARAVGRTAEQARAVGRTAEQARAVGRTAEQARAVGSTAERACAAAAEPHRADDTPTDPHGLRPRIRDDDGRTP